MALLEMQGMEVRGHGHGGGGGGGTASSLSVALCDSVASILLCL
ncbi:MAG: SapB/AmfS family lanthipeptide [Streptosporangiales bacterium]|nr:SapB/AmfS family lanthipeptide [Streptosporangiales bacterium]